MIDIAPHDLETVKRILAKRVAGCEVRAFGSRVTWTAKSASDLDLAIVGDNEISRRILTQLKADFEDSALPFTVDVLDWHKISPEFQQHISKKYEIIQFRQPTKTTTEGWRYLKVSEFADVIGGGTPSTKQPEFWSDDIPWLTPKDMSDHQGRYICCGVRNISRLGLENSSARLVPADTVLLTSRAPVGYVAIAKNPLTTNQGFRSLIIKEAFYPEFIYYLLLNNTEYLRQHATGSTFQEISGSTLKGLEFLIPPFAEQRAIADILGTLDDKIELNRQINQTLEQIAQAIFKSWFVDFEPVRAKIKAKKEGRDPERAAMEAIAGQGERPFAPTEELAATAALFPDELVESELGEIPKGWEVKPMPDAIEVNPARQLKKGVIAPYLDMANVPTNSPRATNVVLREFISGSKFRNGDTLLARITPCLENGKTAFVDFLETDQIGWGSTEFIVFRPKAPLPEAFAYCLCRHPEFRAFAIANMSGTSGRQRVPNDCFENYRFAVPDEAIAVAFGKIVGTVMAGIKERDEESRTLATLRDTLLPKLLSSEIELKEAS